MMFNLLAIYCDAKDHFPRRLELSHVERTSSQFPFSYRTNETRQRKLTTPHLRRVQNRLKELRQVRVQYHRKPNCHLDTSNCHAPTVALGEIHTK